MLSYSIFNVICAAKPLGSELTAQNMPQSQEIEFKDNLILGELNLELDELDFDNMDDDEMVELFSKLKTRCGIIRIRFKQYERLAKNDGP